jgi:phospholipid/cholesterol/gamma-HCH transport system ATP-binding protein
MSHHPPHAPPADLGPEVEIAARRVTKAFGSKIVLQGLDLTIRRGEILAIVGASGSGKTVFMHCLCGLLPISGGEVWVRDHSLPDTPLVQLSELRDRRMEDVRRAWSVVFQHNALFSGTVYENCAVWLRENMAWDEARIEARIRKVLTETALDVGDVLYKDRDALSGGMAKRVAVARALVPDPAVVFYDEPTTGLDPVNAVVIHDLIWQTHHLPSARGTARTSVIVTHDRDLLRRLHPRIIMLDAGRICFDGAYDDFARSASGPPHTYLQLMPVLQAREPSPPPAGAATGPDPSASPRR